MTSEDDYFEKAYDESDEAGDSSSRQCGGLMREVVVNGLWGLTILSFILIFRLIFFTDTFDDIFYVCFLQSRPFLACGLFMTGWAGAIGIFWALLILSVTVSKFWK